MYPLLNRTRLVIKPLASRQSKSDTTCMVSLDQPLPNIPRETKHQLEQLVHSIRQAREKQAPVIMMYGAHLFKNGLAPIVIRLMEEGYIQHLVTNGAGSIHDWEMAFQGKTEEDVRRYIIEGQFGIWEETGAYLNLAVLLGNVQGLGYGSAIGKMICDDGLEIPDVKQIKADLTQSLNEPQVDSFFARKSNLLQFLQTFPLAPGVLTIEHPWKKYSIQYAAYRLKIPLSICPGIGADIIYSHPYNNGAAIGEGALQDFLAFAHTVSQLESGVLVSVGSAVMAPMVFEKAIAMARNLAIQENRPLENYHLVVNDIQPGNWNWQQGEPPKDHPAYYLRFCKSFSRMGGRFEYLKLENTILLQYLYHHLI